MTRLEARRGCRKPTYFVPGAELGPRRNIFHSNELVQPSEKAVQPQSAAKGEREGNRAGFKPHALAQYRLNSRNSLIGLAEASIAAL